MSGVRVPHCPPPTLPTTSDNIQIPHKARISLGFVYFGVRQGTTEAVFAAFSPQPDSAEIGCSAARRRLPLYPAVRCTPEHPASYSSAAHRSRGSCQQQEQYQHPALQRDPTSRVAPRPRAVRLYLLSSQRPASADRDPAPSKSSALPARLPLGPTPSALQSAD
jgi:hypothetical protein